MASLSSGRTMTDVAEVFPSTGPVPCADHPDVETRLRCSRCGRPICPRCSVRTPVGMRCPDCAGTRSAVAANPARTLVAAGAGFAVAIGVGNRLGLLPGVAVLLGALARIRRGRDDGAVSDEAAGSRLAGHRHRHCRLRNSAQSRGPCAAAWGKSGRDRDTFAPWCSARSTCSRCRTCYSRYYRSSLPGSDSADVAIRFVGPEDCTGHR